MIIKHDEAKKEEAVQSDLRTNSSLNHRPSWTALSRLQHNDPTPRKACDLFSSFSIVPLMWPTSGPRQLVKAV